jgi:hypothetical protein
MPQSAYFADRQSAVGALAYWLAFWAWVLDPEEHALVRGLLRRSG